MHNASSKCPNCGAQAEFEEGKCEYTCEYCGSKVKIQPEDDVKDVENIVIDMSPKGGTTAKQQGCIGGIVIIAFFAIFTFIVMSNIFSKETKKDESNHKTIIITEKQYNSQNENTENSKETANPKEISITMPKTPVTLNCTVSSTGTVITKTEVNSAKWEEKASVRGTKENEVNIKFTFGCKKVYDWTGDKGTGSAMARLIIKNGANEIIETKQMYKMTVSMNQIFDLECDVILAAGESYIIEIDDYVM